MTDIVEGDGADKVDAKLMMRHVGQLARWTKLAGSAEEAKSLRYVEKQMASYGYSTKVLHHPAYISLPGPARVVVDGVELKAITHSMGLSSPHGGLSVPVVYLGKATEADFAGRDVRGSIVLVDGMATPQVAFHASKAGAVGQLHISPHEHLHEMCISPVWGSPSARVIKDMPTTVALTIDANDGAVLRERLARGEKPRVILHAEVDTGWRPTPILVADMAAPDAGKKTPFVLFSGHHDTWYQGVMDNGTANATMMEVARLSARRRTEWRRSLRFCFWSGHSQGRYSGSSWYADAHWQELEQRCAVHVNVDSTGGAGAMEFAEAPAATEFAAIAHQALVTETGHAFSGSRISRNADQSFWGIGIPSIFSVMSTQPDNGLGLRSSLGWWWHTPHDLIDKIDPDLLERDTRVYRHLIARLLTDPVLPIDIDRQVEDLAGTLAQIGLDDDADIGMPALLADVAALKRACANLPGHRQRTSSAGSAQDIDLLLMRLSRALVPMDYTNGDRFSHDPALPQAKWPVLDPLRHLATIKRDLPDWYPQQFEARRAVNRLRSALASALGDVARYS